MAKVYHVCSFTDSYDNYSIVASSIEEVKATMRQMGLSTETHWISRDADELSNDLYERSAE
jgi:hypothetical protein